MRSRWLIALAVAFGPACTEDGTLPPPAGGGFEGVSWVAPDRDGRLVVSWKPLEGAKEYRVYASLHPGRALRKAAVASTPSTSLVLAPSEPGATHFVVVRAVDAEGREDANALEKSAVATPDTVPPTFAGAREAAPFANAGVTLSWDPAVDDASPPEAIAYDVFAGPTAQSLAPVGRTTPGVTTFSVAALGAPAEPFVFQVRARDVADNVSAEGKVVTGPLGGDVVPPSFAGCETVSDVGSRSLTISWRPAVDDHSAPEAIQYEIYAAPATGAQDFAAAPLEKVKGSTSVDLSGLEAGRPYFFVCRARDAAGNLDANTSERTVTTSADVTAPVFGGLTDAAVDDIARTVVLSWTAATDDTTAPAAIVYDVFETEQPGIYDFSAPRATTAPGATTITLTDLTPRTSLSWVVRARDEAKNRDLNLSEKGGTTKTSFSVNVQPILQHSCAVVGCHVTGIAPAGLNLAAAFAYDQLVGAPSREMAPKMRVAQGTADPLGDSWLYEKITSIKPARGAQMPAPETGNTLSQLEKDIITSWILEGASRN